MYPKGGGYCRGSLFGAPGTVKDTVWGGELALGVRFRRGSACVWGRFETVWVSDRRHCDHHEHHDAAFVHFNDDIDRNDTPIHNVDAPRNEETRIQTRPVHTYNRVHGALRTP